MWWCHTQDRTHRWHCHGNSTLLSCLIYLKFCIHLCCRAGEGKAASSHPRRASIQWLWYCLSVCITFSLSSSSVPCSLFLTPMYFVCVCVCLFVCFLPVPAGPHCPLLPLPANSRYRRIGEQVQDMISYPPLLPKTFPSTSSSSLLGSSSVAMVSGLHPTKMNCCRIFNLFCLYGNVEKVCVFSLGPLEWWNH